MKPLTERLERYIDRTGGPDACHPWIGATVTSRSGARYGKIRKGARDQGFWLVHRVVLALATGNMPGPHIEACHGPACTTTLCCNLAHLRWGTRTENERDKRLEKYCAPA